MAGLAAGRRLQERGWKVTLLDKGRVPGGRMATRTFDGGLFDYGAQFFTLREGVLEDLARPWVATGLATPWGRHRFRARDGMRTLMETMAAGLDVRCGLRVAKVAERPAGWTAELETGDPLTADALLLTAPVPQALTLLEQGGVVLNDQDWALLEKAKYRKSLTLLARIDGETTLGPAGFAEPQDSILAWLADNYAKGVSPVPGCLTIHATHDFSESHWDETAPGVAPKILAAAEAYFTGRVVSYYLHRWRYAEPAVQMPACFHGIGRLAFAGDVFGGPRVSGAAVSGLAAAEYLLQT
jgi:predicted NAD/FAD-dependent oxidoreductase